MGEGPGCRTAPGGSEGILRHTLSDGSATELSMRVFLLYTPDDRRL